jgi:hypothetical protein
MSEYGAAASDSLADMIKQMAHEGWSPQGGISITAWIDHDAFIGADRCYTLYAQALTRRVEAEPQSISSEELEMINRGGKK